MGTITALMPSGMRWSAITSAKVNKRKPSGIFGLSVKAQHLWMHEKGTVESIHFLPVLWYHGFTKEVNTMLSGVFFVIAFLGLLISNGKYEAAKKKQPSKMLCPNCKSRNVKLRKEVSSITRTGLSSYGKGIGVRSGVSNINRQRIAVCQDCGYDYPYTSEADVKQAVASTKSSYHFWLILTIIAAGIGIWIFLH